MGVTLEDLESGIGVEIEKVKVKLDGFEHSDYKWMDFEKALKILKFSNQKKSLEIVNKWLKEKSH